MADWISKILLGLDHLELIVTSAEIRAEGLNNLHYYKYITTSAVHMTRNSAIAEIARIGVVTPSKVIHVIQGH